MKLQTVNPRYYEYSMSTMSRVMRFIDVDIPAMESYNISVLRLHFDKIDKWGAIDRPYLYMNIRDHMDTIRDIREWI